MMIMMRRRIREDRHARLPPTDPYSYAPPHPRPMLPSGCAGVPS
jgi:hypothetical protein